MIDIIKSSDEDLQQWSENRYAKPHIVKVDNRWHCELPRWNKTKSGTGQTPKQAYNNCINDNDNIVQSFALLRRIRK